MEFRNIFKKKGKSWEGLLNYGGHVKEKVRVYDGLVNDGRDFDEKYGVMKDYGVMTDIQKEHKEL